MAELFRRPRRRSSSGSDPNIHSTHRRVTSNIKFLACVGGDKSQWKSRRIENALRPSHQQAQVDDEKRIAAVNDDDATAAILGNGCVNINIIDTPPPHGEVTLQVQASASSPIKISEQPVRSQAMELGDDFLLLQERRLSLVGLASSPVQEGPTAVSTSAFSPAATVTNHQHHHHHQRSCSKTSSFLLYDKCSAALDVNSSGSMMEEQRDELHSDLYSSVLESLRNQVADCLPQVTEGMISKAIIDGFAGASSQSRPVGHEGQPGDSTGSLEYGDELIYDDKYQLEVEHLHKAWEWGQKQHQKPGPLHDAFRLSTFQDFLRMIFAQIRDENLTSSNRAMRILVNVATVLGVEVDSSVYVPRSTVILSGLQDATRNMIRERLAVYGDVKAAAACNRGGFAFCRFRDEAAVERLLKERSLISIGGVKPTVVCLQDAPCAKACPVPLRHPLPSEDPVKSPSTQPKPFEEDTIISPTCVSKYIADIDLQYWR
jgi:hypothetical protein